MKKVLVVAIVIVFGYAAAFAQQDDHTDEGNPWDIYAVHGAHDDNGFCGNTDGSDNGRDVDCIDRSLNGPREWSTNCWFPGEPFGGMECSASATVYCPGLGAGSGPGKDYINFTCHQNSIPEVRAGILEGFGAFPQKKGVMCRNGYTGTTVSCGCVTTSTSSSYFFGSPQALSVPNYYICQ